MSYLGERRLANFRNRVPAATKNSDKRGQRPGMSEAHLAIIRKLVCCACHKAGGECHHLKAGTGERGMGLRSTDRWAVPMCHHCHMEVERVGSRNEETWFRARGIHAALLAVDLWTNSGDLERMARVLQAHRSMS